MNFEQAVQIVLMHEGGLVNNPRDPGGITRFGISKRSFPNEDILRLTIDRAKELYRKHYWDMCECDSLPPYARLMVFDCAVNQGVTRAVIFLQRMAGTVSDGVIGPLTLSGLGNVDPCEFIYCYSESRMTAYMSNPNWNTFGKGWIKRLSHIAYLSYRRLIPSAVGSERLT